jgi:DNA topoisomerase-1
MTSTLQQEASRKFGFGARMTMNAAQRLYEAGLITYMRTDGIDMAPEAITAARDAIAAKFGKDYVPDTPRIYKNKAKNAQEAHECIRPTDLMLDAETAKIADPDQRKLYDLIYKRTVSSQMAAARMERTSVDFGSADGQVELRATGQVVLFDGFLAIYEEGRDDDAADDDGDDKRLPQMTEGEKMAKSSVTAEQHFTQPPPRYTEATLVKRMEELGIGRPSTYASIVTTIQDREYVRKEKNRLIPEDKGRLVTAFLTNFFRKYVGYDYTASLEEELDHVSAGEADYKKVLSDFWGDFKITIDEAMDMSITQVLDKINEVLAPHIFPPNEEGTDPRLCPNCNVGRLSMRTARSGGAFIGCSNYPECKYTRAFGPPGQDDASGIPPEGKELGMDDGDKIWIHKGRFGPYAQRGEVTEENKKPNRQSVPKEWPPEDVTLETAVKLLSLPRLIGTHPEDGVNVFANIGRYGPYIKHAESTSDRGGTNANLEGLDDVFTVGMNYAVQLLAEKVASRGNRGGAAKTLKSLGDHPDEGGPIDIMEGKYGPYVKWEKVNATLPKDSDPEALTIQQAVDLITEKQAKKGTKRKAPAKKKAAPKKAPAKKPAAKKTAVKKPAAKKAAPKAIDTGDDVLE